MKDQLHRYPGLILIVIGLLLLGCGIYGLTQPDEFRASARIFIPEEIPPNFVYLHPSGPEAIKSDTLLSNVVWELQLASDPTSPEDTTQDIKTTKAIVALQKRLDFNPVQNTRLFDVKVTENTPKRAATCANAVALAYKAWVSNSRLALVQSVFQDLRDELKAQEQRASKLETELHSLRESLKLPSLDPPESDLEASYPAYFLTKKKLIEENDILKFISFKIAKEETELESLRNSPQIEIVETAIPPTSPLRRKNLLGLALIGVGLSCCLWGVLITRDAKLPG